METIALEIIKILFPAILGFISSWMLNNKQLPNKNLEIAYNRIYYPLYILIQNNISNENIDYVQIKNIIEAKIAKYQKYFNPTTIRVYKQFKKSIEDNYNIKNTYSLLKENIYTQNTYLRKTLGYLTPNFFQIYYHSSKKDKFTLRIIMYIVLIYVTTFSYSILYRKFGKIIINIGLFIIITFVIDTIIHILSYIPWIVTKIRRG